MIERGLGSIEEQTSWNCLLIMGNAIALQIEEILMAEFDPDWCGSERLHCFDCLTWDMVEGYKYQIMDRELSLQVYIPSDLVVREQFNLAK